MKKLIILSCLATVASNGFSQGAMVVSDPTSVVQRLTLAAEQMEEQIDQKYKFVEQIQIAKQSLESAKKMQEKVEKVSSYVKDAKEVAEIVTIGENIVKTSNNMRKNIKKTAALTITEKAQTILDLADCSSNVSKIAKQASAVVQNKTEKNDVSLSDFERRQELRALKKEMESTQKELNRIYNKAFTKSVSNTKDKSLFSFLNF
jgi:phage shock protein A